MLKSAIDDVHSLFSIKLEVLPSLLNLVELATTLP